MVRCAEALQQYKPGPPLVPGVWFEYEIKVNGKRFTVVLQNLESGAREQTTHFENSDAERGVAKADGRPLATSASSPTPAQR